MTHKSEPLSTLVIDNVNAYTPDMIFSRLGFKTSPVVEVTRGSFSPLLKVVFGSII